MGNPRPPPGRGSGRAGCLCVGWSDPAAARVTGLRVLPWPELIPCPQDLGLPGRLSYKLVFPPMSLRHGRPEKVKELEEEKRAVDSGCEQDAMGVGGCGGGGRV